MPEFLKWIWANAAARDPALLLLDLFITLLLLSALAKAMSERCHA
jgi:hypothetical protein